MKKKTLAMAMVVFLMAVFVGAQDRTPSAADGVPGFARGFISAAKARPLI
jgi:hypothetical protein